MILSGSTYSYDFSTTVTQAYNGLAGYKEIVPGGFSVMVAGDGDHDGKIFTSDFNDWSSNFGPTNVYSYFDYDMDKSIFASDYNVWSGNFGKNNPVNSFFNDLIKYSCQIPQK
jgi:hypothetical protein